MPGSLLFLEGKSPRLRPDERKPGLAGIRGDIDSSHLYFGPVVSPLLPYLVHVPQEQLPEDPRVKGPMGGPHL